MNSTARSLIEIIPLSTKFIMHAKVPVTFVNEAISYTVSGRTGIPPKPTS